MPDLPEKKVGIIACSGEELSEGTITRLAARKVLDELQPGNTVTICLPLFLAGGEGDRTFAKFYPTIAIDGCEKRCAYRGTEMYSNKPARSVVVTELITEQNLRQPTGKRELDQAGNQIVEAVAGRISEQVDELLGKGWNRRAGAFSQPEQPTQGKEEGVTTCSCGSGIPIQKLVINGREFTMLALPLIFQNFYETRKSPSDGVMNELMETVKIYNAIDSKDEPAIRVEIEREYRTYWQKREAKHE